MGRSRASLILMCLVVCMRSQRATATVRRHSCLTASMDHTFDVDNFDILKQEALADAGILDSMLEERDDEEDPHPLRTREWKIEMSKNPLRRRQSVEVSFHRNGTVCTSAGHSGEWWFDVGGVYWDVNATVGGSPTVLHHKAELHWNVFGTQPRMFRGTVIRDRLPGSFLPPWLLRPVVSSFVGCGVGDDTADTSYRHRQLSGPRSEEPTNGRYAPRTDRY